MKVLIVVQHANFFRNLDDVLRELCRRGHKVVFLHGSRLDDGRASKRKAIKSFGRGLEVAQSEIPSVTVGYRPEPPERLQRALIVGRQVLNRASYLRKAHPSPERTLEGIDRELSPTLQRMVTSPLGRKIFRTRPALAAWRWIEAATPPSPTLVALLRELNPDVMLDAPTIWPKGPVEADYVRAAQSLGIPVLGYVNSWDNLTSKGTVHVLPDAYIVWNEPLAREAIELHDVPAHTIRITGAPHLDRMFELRPSVSRGAMCAIMGCPSDLPYIVYLCSSRSLMQTEVPTVTALAEAFSATLGDKAPTIVVRPHPTNPFPWEGYSHPGVAVYPGNGDMADCPEAWQEYYNQLSLATCVFGLNTTAFLEAVVADRPCLTIVAEEFFGAQGRTGHFRHLLKGDFMEISPDATDVARRVQRLLDGHDEKADGRRRFVEWFIRPCGVDRPVAPVVTDLIERMALPSAAQSPDVLATDPVPGLTFSAQGIV
jgi:hypothetical protein